MNFKNGKKILFFYFTQTKKIFINIINASFIALWCVFYFLIVRHTYINVLIDNTVSDMLYGVKFRNLEISDIQNVILYFIIYIPSLSLTI